MKKILLLSGKKNPYGEELINENWILNAAAQAGGVTAVGNVLTWTDPHNDYAQINSQNGSEVGKTYKLEFDVTANAGTLSNVYFGVGRSNISSNTNLAIGHYIYTTTSAHIDGFYFSVRTNGTITVENVSVKEVL